MSDDDVVVIEIDTPEAVVVVSVDDSAVSIIGLPDPGSGSGDGTLNPVVDWFTGTGAPPDALIGAGPGDMYIDITNGTLYQLR